MVSDDNDTLDLTPPLQEKDFIQESYKKNPFPFWMWVAVFACIVGLMWGTTGWFRNARAEAIKNAPFLQVTNRQMSLFLWQFTHFMRASAPVKEGYLPDFSYENGNVNILPGRADHIVSAPPEVLFVYHTWARLLKKESALRIPKKELFEEFLTAIPEWEPQNWPEAPDSYRQFVNQLANMKQANFEADYRLLPLDVQIAMTGWRNYNKEGDAINKAAPTYEEMGAFLVKSPHYARNFWVNIVRDKKPNYLLGNFKGGVNPKNLVPENEMTAFLKTAYYNFTAESVEKPSE